MKSIKVKTIFTIVVLLLVAIFILYVGKVNAVIENNSITVKCTFAGSTTIPLNEITSIDYVKSFDIGKRKFGIGTMKVKAGTYKNDEFGNYKLYTYSKVDAYIIVHYGDNALVFNQSSIEATDDVYEQLKSKVNEKKIG